MTLFDSLGSDADDDRKPMKLDALLTQLRTLIIKYRFVFVGLVGIVYLSYYFRRKRKKGEQQKSIIGQLFIIILVAITPLKRLGVESAYRRK